MKICNKKSTYNTQYKIRYVAIPNVDYCVNMKWHLFPL